ncbi:MAG: glutamine amidotransferase-related protein [Dongiaceae bacterium]
MSKTILLVTQTENSSAPDGRVGPLLESKGYAVEWRCPAKGDWLPDNTESYAGTVVFGGPMSVNDTTKLPFLTHEIEWIAQYVAAGGRYFGICLGGQLLARAFGAPVARHPDGLNEIGYYPICATAAGAELIDDSMHVYHWHNEGFQLPGGAELLAVGDAFPNQAFKLGQHAYGVQFHPEVTPKVARSWIDEVPHQLAWPGAQPRDQHEDGFARHDSILHAWMSAFFDHWLGHQGPGNHAPAPQPAPSAIIPAVAG